MPGCGSIGTAYLALADALVGAGHEVVCIFSNGLRSSPLQVAQWSELFHARGLTLVVPPASAVPIKGLTYSVRSYEVYAWLKDNDRFDIVHFPDWQALGYHTQVAKRQGLAFAHSCLCVGLYGPTEWRKFTERRYYSDTSELQLDHMERESVAMADVLVSPDRERIEWVYQRGWVLPSICHVYASQTPQNEHEVARGMRTWASWHEQRAEQERGRALSPVTVEWPKVSLCLVTYNRPLLLAQALDSIRAISYPKLEVVLVDDGSTDAAAVATLASLEPEFSERGWQVVRQANRYLGAARNAGARHATGDLLLFMDDDNYAEPHEVETLVCALMNSGADIVCCGVNFFSGQTTPDLASAPGERWLPVGGAAAAGAFENCFGDANALVRRSCFDALGGFTEDFGVTHEDWEFHARAVLAGFKLQVVPEFLFWYRVNAGSMIRTLPAYPNYQRSLRPYVNAVPPALQNLVRCAQGVAMKAQADAETMALERRYAQATIAWRSKLEAGLALLQVNQKPAAVQMMLQGLKAAEATKEAPVVLEALMNVCTHLAPLDPARTRMLLDAALKIATRLGRDQAVVLATQLLQKLSRDSVAPATRAA